MDISIYDKKWIVPAKCGSRYLDKAFGVTEQNNVGVDGIENRTSLNKWRNLVLDSPHTKIVAQSDNIFQFWVLPITHIVLRNPLSHLLSALHTDLWGHIDEPTRAIGLVKGNLHLEEILLKYTKDGTGHWSPHLYYNLYMLLQKRPDIKVVPIEGLTELLNESGFELEYVPSEYNFEKAGEPSRGEIINWVKTEYPSIWKRIWERYELDVKWANRITENVGLPKIKKRKRKLI
jgi:hypothetical protein